MEKEDSQNFQDFIDKKLAKLSFNISSQKEYFEDYDIVSEVSSLVETSRKQAKLTQKDLSEKTGLTQSNISNIEKKITTPTIESLKKIADAMGKRLVISFKDKEELF